MNKIYVVRKPNSSRQFKTEIIQEYDSAQLKYLNHELFYLNPMGDIFHCSDKDDAEVIAEHALSLQKAIEEKDESYD